LVVLLVLWLYAFLLHEEALAASTVFMWGSVPTMPANLTNAVAIAAGNGHYLALNGDRSVLGWGDNGAGQANPPLDLTNAVFIAAGEYHSLAVRADGTIAAWGQGTNTGSWPNYGQASVPIGLSNVMAVAGGDCHSLALRSNGTVFAWGRNDSGQATVPSGLTNVVGIAAGWGNSLALRADGTVVGWPNAAQVPTGLTNVVAIAAHVYQAMALKADGTVVGWGRDYSSAPSSMTNAVAIAAGYAHALALTANRTVRAWGYNYYGQVNVPAGLTNVAAVAAGYYSSLALVTNGPPLLITAPPQSQAVLAGTGALFGVQILSSLPVTYQWRFNGTNLPGVNSSTLSLANVQPAQAGLYAVTINNAVGAVTSTNAMLTVIPLIITVPPANQVVVAGQTATFGVYLQGSAPFSYQWRYNGSDLDGATNAVLTLMNVQPSHAGLYSVRVSNVFGAAISSSASLTVLPLVITVPPQCQVVARGQTAIFSVIAQGVSPFSYHWQFNGGEVSDATNNTLVLTNVQLSQAGRYSVTVSNACGATTNLDAALIVNLIVAWGANGSGQTNVPLGLTNVCGIAAGGAHSMVLNADGTIVAWGANASRQTNVPPGLTNAVAIAAGTNHSLALTTDEAVVAWGNNDFGQTNVPLGLGNVIAIAGGGNHSLALRSNQKVVAWGDNGHGQTNVPPNLANAVAIAGGGAHSLALTVNGAVVCWGDNSYGQVNVPADLTNVVAIAAGGMHSLALKGDSTVVAWGNNSYGQTNAPSGLTNVVAISAGGNHSMALKLDGSVLSWGDQTNVPAALPRVAAIGCGGAHSLALVGGGPVGLDGPPFIPTPLLNRTALGGTVVQFLVTATGTGPLRYQWRFNGTSLPEATNALLNLSDVQPTQAGAYSVVVSNAFGVVASPEALLVVLPLLVSNPPQDRIALVGGSATFSLTVESTLPLTYQWHFNGVSLPGATNSTLTLANLQLSQAGAYSVAVSNAFGGLLSPDAALSVSTMELSAWGGDFYSQADVPSGLANVVMMAGGFYHCLALKEDGSVVAWGYNASGQASVPFGLANVVAVAGGWGHSLALKADGTVVAWGDDYYGQANVPSSLSNVVAIAAGWAHSVALKADGTLVAWGWDAYGQTDVPAGQRNVVAIAAGHSHNVAVKADGRVFTWGYGALGETNVPSGLSNVVAVAAGWDHNLALRADGGVVAWGWNTYGQTNVPAGLSNVVAIAAGREHSMALRADGAVVAWGGDSYDQTNVPTGLPDVVAIAAGGYHSLALLDTGSTPRLSAPAHRGSTFSLSLWTFLRKSYSLEFKNSLAETNWTMRFVLPGDGTRRTLSDTNADGRQRFYRVRVQ
jgi:alpha-tubulin suppressor-like RCC1 family protein